MKAIAIVELPDDAFELSDTWIIDDEGSIRYEDENVLMHFRDIKLGEIELRPLPKKLEPNTDDEPCLIEGWNACLKQITGETE